ncbi:MAG: hypothetical protein ACI9KE_002598 [Polyangiales bacterium]|jgi:hypothetical protein
MGLFDKMKSFAGGHGVTVTLLELDGGSPDAHTMDLDATSLRGVFRVQATKADAVVLLHKVALTVRFTGRHAQLDAFEDNTTYTVTPDGARDVPFSFANIDVGQAMKSLGLGEHALVIDKRAILEVSVFVDVKGSPVDPRITHSVQVIDQEDVAAAAAKAAAAPDGSVNWKQRIDAMVKAIEADESTDVRLAEVGAPATDAEIKEVHDAIGFELDPKFLGFFRATNGLRLIWVTSHFDKFDDPIEHYHAQTELQSAGRINVPSLRELFIDGPGYLFGPDTCGPKQYTDKCLGGWDQHALRTALRNIDDFAQQPGDSSFYLPGLVVSARYPDPPVIMTDDYAAALSDGHPMLASDYLAFVIATMGRPHSRMDRLKSRGFGGNHDLFVPPSGWLEGAPSPVEVLSVVHDAVSLEENTAINAALEQLATCEGQPVSESPYASYNQPPPRGPQVVSNDPNAGMRTAAPEADWSHYLEGFEGNLTLPLYDETHYTIKEPATNLEELKKLIGQPVKSSNKYMVSVGCLISIDADGVGTLFTASDGACGTSSFALDDSEVGRAWHLE